MKLTRLIGIIILLLNRQTVTAKEFAKRFDVTVRTIYRDVDDLSAAGVPIYMIKGKGGGISLLEDYSINKMILSESERRDLTFALKAMQAIKYPEIDAVLEKIGAVFKSGDNSDWVKIDFTGWGSAQKEQDKFTDIKNAILRRNIIRFDYINANGESSNRFVEPEQLYFNKYTWYLHAFCRNKNEHRVFRISRIKNIIVINERFQKRIISDEEKTKNHGYEKAFVDLHLRFSEKMLYRLYDEFDEEFLKKNDNGSYDVHIALPEDDWLYGYILSYGHFAEVISPEHIRMAIAESMEAALKFYS